MKKNKKQLIQPALLASAFVAAELFTLPSALALTLKPLDGGAKKHAAAPPPTTVRPVAARPVAARPGTVRTAPAILKKPLTKPGVTPGAKKAAIAKSPAAPVRKPIQAAQPDAGGQLLVIMRSDTKLTPALLTSLSQAAHTRLSHARR